MSEMNTTTTTPAKAPKVVKPTNLGEFADALIVARATLVALVEALDVAVAEANMLNRQFSMFDSPQVRAFVHSATRGARRAVDDARSEFNDAARAANEAAKGLVPPSAE
jgi:hypothetical protein